MYIDDINSCCTYRMGYICYMLQYRVCQEKRTAHLNDRPSAWLEMSLSFSSEETNKTMWMPKSFNMEPENEWKWSLPLVKSHFPGGWISFVSLCFCQNSSGQCGDAKSFTIWWPSEHVYCIRYLSWGCLIQAVTRQFWDSMFNGWSHRLHQFANCFFDPAASLQNPEVYTHKSKRGTTTFSFSGF